MTTYPSNPNQDWTSTQAAPWQTSSPDTSTMGAYFPPTSARPTAPVQQAPSYGPAYGQQYPPAYAWSAEQPEFNSASAAYPAQQPWYARPRVLAFAGAGFVAAAAAGLFGALHGSSHSTPVNMATHNAPAPAAAPAPAPAPAPAAKPSAPSYRVVALVNVERQLLQGGEPSSATSEPASAYPAARSVVLLGSLAVEQQQQLSVELLR